MTVWVPKPGRMGPTGPQVTPLVIPTMYCSGDMQTSSTACTTTAGLVDSFGPGHFYKTDQVTPSSAIATSAGTECDVASNNEATVYITERTAGYEITQTDEVQALVHWRVDIPWIRIEPTKLHNGECIYVLVEFLKQGITGICFDCPPVCWALIKVACVCCEDVDNTSSCFFPYFTSTKAADPSLNLYYWNGIAIQNTSAIAGTATLLVSEADGVGKATYVTDEIPPGGMFVKALEEIDFGPSSTLGNGPVFIAVTTTFPGMDGFAMMANDENGDSMGYLCRKPCTK